MKEYTVRYKLEGVGRLTFMANSAEEAEKEFNRIMCGDRSEIEQNRWIDQDVIYDVEWDDEILSTTKKDVDEDDNDDEDSLSYYRIDCNNGFCGCEETFYVALPQDVDIDEYAQDVLENDYSFYEPDGRFIPNKSWGDDITEEEYDDYMEDVGVDWEEITREEYEENHE